MPIKILVADDDKAILRLYSRIFVGAKYVVTKAETFKEAAGLLRKDDYDLLITDLMFPDGVGTELIKIFNKSKSGARAILVTGTTGAKEELERQGVRDYIEKPFKVEKILEAVDKALG